MYMCIYIYIYTYTYVYVYMCVCVYTYIYIYIYIYSERCPLISKSPEHDTSNADNDLMLGTRGDHMLQRLRHIFV